MYKQSKNTDVFCYKAIVQFSQVFMCKTIKNLFKGHVTHIVSILMSFFTFSFKPTLFLLMFSLLFWLLNFDFTIYFYNLVLY